MCQNAHTLMETLGGTSPSDDDQTRRAKGCSHERNKDTRDWDELVNNSLTVGVALTARLNLSGLQPGRRA